MKAIMYGGGNIGRGFIGMLFSQSGYETAFIDVAEPLVSELNRRHSYPVRILSSEGFNDVCVSNVSAINGNDTEAVAKAIAECDIMATAVGVNILKFIIPNLVSGIKRRFASGGKPLNIIICENLNNANLIVEKMIKEHLSPDECRLFDEKIGLVEASIGRMVPIQTDEMRDGDPLRVCVEKYGFLPVDKDAFKGEIPNVTDMYPFSPFDYFIKRKLYIHNMGHAICAYLGDAFGYEYIWQAIDDPEIRIITQNAMLASAAALSKQYGVALAEITEHINDLLFRFTNKALGDTCARVGREPERKLSPDDRLCGPSLLCKLHGIDTSYIAVGIAAALKRLLCEKELPQTAENAEKMLASVSGEKNAAAIKYYKMLTLGATLHEIRTEAEKDGAKARPAII